MDAPLIIVAFILGFGARVMGLPPLVGYLVAGFALNAMAEPVMERYGIDVTGGRLIGELADLGVMLLLFSIGLKLKIGSLLRREVWAGTSAHMIATVIVFGTGLFVLAALGLPRFTDLDWKLSLLVAFALSFSSTVFAVKVLEDAGEEIEGLVREFLSVGKAQDEAEAAEARA